MEKIEDCPEKAERPKSWGEIRDGLERISEKDKEINIYIYILINVLIKGLVTCLIKGVELEAIAEEAID